MEINNSGLCILNDGDYVPYKIPQGKVILCGVPGAFTPDCTKRHLPGFAKNLDKNKEAQNDGQSLNGEQFHSRKRNNSLAATPRINL